MDTLPQQGKITWIGLRPEKKATMLVVDSVQATTDNGLLGDRYSGRTGKRQVTLIQQEHLDVIASVMAIPTCSPEMLRRNIVVHGLNLLSLKNKQFRIGETILEYTGLCHPCSFMEDVFGDGGYNAVRGHGGITARIVQNGTIKLNDCITVEATDKNELTAAPTLI